MSSQVFSGKVFMKERNRAIQVAKESLANLTVWCDGFKLDQGKTEAVVVWKRDR